jgi:recombination protein RecA
MLEYISPFFTKKLMSDKQEALKNALVHIRKSYGEGSIMQMNEAVHMKVETIPTGSLSLDLALGGGVPRGRIVEVFGPESAGKTTLALHVAAEAQKKGGKIAVIDAEHALNTDFAQKIGLNLDSCTISQPDSGEEALEITEILVRSGAIDLIIVDSVAALTPKAEIEGMMGDSHMGLQARLMSQALRKLTAAVSKSRCTVVFINQIRHKIGVMFGSPETTTGGNALKFYSSVRLDIRRIAKIEQGVGVDKKQIGNRVKVKVVKNKVAPPFREAEFDLMFAEGISRTGDVLDLAVNQDIVKKAGAFFSFEDVKLGQGRENSKLFLKENPEVMKKIEKKLSVELSGEEVKSDNKGKTKAKATNAKK